MVLTLTPFKLKLSFYISPKVSCSSQLAKSVEHWTANPTIWVRFPGGSSHFCCDWSLNLFYSYLTCTKCTSPGVCLNCQLLMCMHLLFVNHFGSLILLACRLTDHRLKDCWNGIYKTQHKSSFILIPLSKLMLFRLVCVKIR